MIACNTYYYHGTYRTDNCASNIDWTDVGTTATYTNHTTEYTSTTTTPEPAGEVLEPPAPETATWTPVRERNQRRGINRQRPAELPSSYG